MSLRRLAGEHPVTVAVACALAQMLLTLAILKVGFTQLPPEAAGKVKLAAFASTVLLPLVLVWILGLWREVGLGFRGARLTAPFVGAILVCAMWLAMGIHPPEGSNFLGDAAMQLVNAFGEELLFRGVIFAILLSQPRWQAIALNAVLFGSMHLIHGYMDGDWGAALHQAFFTTMGGALFAAMRYSTGSLWLVIGLHAVLNLCIIYSNIGPALGEGAEDAAQWIAGLAQVALAVWVIARGRGRRAGVPA